jgi:sigma-B regulation protein RsbU (phosphoserine phosphatase)
LRQARAAAAIAQSGTCCAAAQRVTRTSTASRSRTSSKRLSLARSLEPNGFRVAAVYSPAQERGGDFYVIAPRKSGDTLVVIGDVCGRGSTAAEFAEKVGPYVRVLAQSALTAGEFLSMANSVVARTLPEELFVTAACAVLDARKGHAMIANAGHVPPILRRLDGITSVVARASGPPLGTIPNFRWAEEPITLELGDVLVLMTDGVVEAIEEDLLEMPALSSIVSGCADGIERINRRIFSEVERRGGRGDDLTLLSLELASNVSRGRPARIEACAGMV